MRIIGGIARGREIKTPPGQETRPTLSRVRESVFDILGPLGKDFRFLDLFAGSGGVGLEAQSRGASVLFVEVQPSNCELIRTNQSKTGLSGSEIWCRDVFQAIEQLGSVMRKFDGVFADPPYQAGVIDRVLEAVAQAGILSKEGLFLGQVSAKEQIKDRVGDLVLKREYRYGNTKLVSYSRLLKGV